MENNGNYLKIPLSLFKMKITTVERYIISLALSYKGNLYASNATIAKMFGITSRAVKYAVSSLDEKKLISCERVEGKGRTITLRGGEITSLLNTGSGEITSPGSEITSPEVVKKLPPSGEITSPNRKGNKTCYRKSKEKRGRFTPPTLDEVKEYIQQNPEITGVDPVHFYKGFNDSNWIDTKGNPVRNWKLKIRTWSSYANDSNRKPNPNRHESGNQQPFIR